MVLVATLLGAHHYKASTGFSSYIIDHTTSIASLTNKFNDNNLHSLEDRMEDWQSCLIRYPP